MFLPSEKIALIRNYFISKPVIRAYLFGSYVRGEATESSDIDILVDLDYRQKIGLGFIQMQLDLENLLHSKVDLVFSNGVSKYLQVYIEQEKQEIYAR